MIPPFALTFDYLCPFARNANEHVVTALRGGADWDVRFVPYSLAQGHVEEGETPVWERPETDRVAGLLALQAGVVVRDTDPEHFLDVHEALFAARHDQGEDLRDAAVVAAALTAGGADAPTVMAAIDRGEVLAQVRTEHERAVADHQVWGVPTFITDQRAVFVRLMDRPEGDVGRATTRIEQVVALVEGPLELHEFKQTDLSV